MALPNFTDIAAKDERFKSLPADKKLIFAERYWDKYAQENPDDTDYLEKQKADSLAYITDKAELEDAAPVQKRFIEAGLEATKFNLALRDGIKSGKINPDEAPRITGEWELSQRDRQNQAVKAANFFREDNSKALADLSTFAREGAVFTPEKLANKIGFSDRTTEESRGQYESARDAVAEQFGFKSEELDDVVKHQLDAQKEPVSRDAFGTVHIKNDVLFKGADEVKKAIESSNLPASTKAKQLNGLDGRLSAFEANVVETAAKNYPEYAEFIGLNGENDFKKITDSLVSGVAENESTALVNGLRSSGVSILNALNKLPGSREDRSNLFASVADQVDRSRKIDEGQLALSGEIQKDKLRFLGTTGGTVGSGVGSVIESAAVAYATGGLVPTISGAGRGVAAVNAALKVAPVASIFGARQGMQTYDQALKAGIDEKEATRLGVVSGLIEGGLTTAFSALGLGGIESIAAGATKEAVKKTATSALKESFKALGKGVLGEELEENTINAVNAALVDSKINPNMTVEDFKQSVLDTTVATLLPSAAISGVDAVSTYKQNNAELERRANAINSQEDLPSFEDAGGADTTGSTPTVVDPATLNAEREAVVTQAQGLPPSPERSALEERVAEIDSELANVETGIPVTENADLGGQTTSTEIPADPLTTNEIAPENIPTEPQPDTSQEFPISEQVPELGSFEESQAQAKAIHKQENAKLGKFGEDLNSLEQKWENSNVDLKISQTKDGNIELEVVRIPESEQRKGLGSKVLTDLKDLSNSTGKSIELLPVPIGSNSVEDLERFYERNGFEPYDRGLTPSGRPRQRGYRYTPSAEIRSNAPVTQQSEQVSAPTLPNETTPPPAPRSISATNAATDRILKENNLPPIAKEARKAIGTSWDQAVEITKGNSDAGPQLVASIKAKPRPINDVEQGVLLKQLADTKIRAAKAEQAVKTAALSNNEVALIEAETALQRARSEISDVVSASQLAGAEWGRSGRFRQISINENYDIVSMQTRVQTEINRGQKLTPDQNAVIKDLQEKIAKADENAQVALIEQEGKLRDEYEKIITDMMASEENRPARKKTVKQKTADLDRQIKDASARLRKKLGQFNSGVDITIVGDLAVIGQAYIRKGIISLKAYADTMANEYGETTRQYAEQAFERSKELLSNSGLAKTPQQLLAEIDPNKEVNRQTVFNMTKAYVREGLRGKAAIDQVTKDLQSVWSGITREMVSDYITGYGREIKPTQNELRTELNNIKKIENLTRRINDLKAGRKSETRGRSNQQVNDEVKRLQKEIRDLTKQVKVKPTAEDRLVDAAKKRSATIREKIAKGDFTKEVKPKPEITKRVEEARLEEMRAKEEWNRLFFQAALDRQTKLQKAGRILVEPINISRTLKTIIDLPPIFRQGWLTALSRPSIALKNLPKAIVAGVSENEAKNIESRMREHPRYALAKAAKLSLTDSGPYASMNQQEEEFRGRWAKKIPIVKYAVNFSERNYTSYLNGLRMDWFAKLVDNVSVTGDLSVDEAKIIANFVNNTTGRGDLKGLEQSASVLSAVFFSPRYWASRINTILGVLPVAGDVVTGFKLRSADTVRARKAIAKEYARMLIGYGVFYGAVMYAAGGLLGDDGDDDKLSIIWNPNSTDFGKIKIGRTRFDPLAGMGSNIVVTSRVLTGESVSPVGKTRKLDSWQAYLGVVGSFIRGKAAPVPGAVINYKVGTDVVGNPTTLRGETVGLFLPMSPADITTQFQEFGPEAAVGASMLTLLGMGVQIHDDRLSLQQRIAIALGDEPEDFAKKSKATGSGGFKLR